MRYVLPLLCLLSASCLGAAELDASQAVWRINPPLTVGIAGAQPGAGVEGFSETLVFDSFTGATTYTVTGGSPRTFMGMPFNLGGAVGNDPAITRITFYLAYAGTTAQTYQSLRVHAQLWDGWSDMADPVFSVPMSPTFYDIDVPGPISLVPNSFLPIDVTFPIAVRLSGLLSHGIAVNYLGDTGSGLASSDNLTSLLRYGAVPVAVGANGLAAAYGYRDASNRSDFNFAPGDARSFGEANEAIALQMFAIPALAEQVITDFVATPAAPVYSDGSFTVSATGGGSGNPVTFSIDAGSASVCSAGGTNGSTITILATGACTVLADQAGDAFYSAAPQQSLIVPIASAQGELVQDGSFEAGFATAYWTQTSTNFGTPMCDTACGGAGPRTGTFWVWFGGISNMAEAGSVEQTGLIAAGPKRLEFYVWWASSVATPPDPAATFDVKIDGNTIFSLTPATASDYSAGYTLASVDISAYADGNNHTLRFEASNAAVAGPTNINLDDISIIDIVAADTIFEDGFDGP